MIVDASVVESSGANVGKAEDGELNPSVVASLYLEHGEEIRRFLIGLLRDPHLAADVLQATFAKLVERGHESREETRKAWLFRVAYHEAMYVRRRGAVGDRVVQQVAWMLPEASEHAEGPLLRFEIVDRVRRALEELPPDQRQVVRMRIYEEKTFAVIADELQIPLGTALGRMRTALQKLKGMLGEE